MEITKKEIKDGLRRLGLKKGDTVIVHSSLSSVGQVEGGAETVIRALQETVGTTGTVMMPYPLGSASIARIFSGSPGVVRSFHPTHSIAAWGENASAMTKNHIKSPTACGKNTPYGRLIAANGYILLLGVDQDRNTTLHTVEEYADLPYLSDHRVEYTDSAGRKRVKILKKYPGPHRNFIGIDKLLAESGAMKTGKIGNASARLIKAKPMADILLKELKKNPALFLCDNPNCMDCVMQRGKIAGLNLKGESFKLTAVNDEISMDADAVISALKKEGLRHVELCTVGGKPLLKTPEKVLRELKKKLSGAKIAVSGIDTGITPDSTPGAIKKGFALAKFFGAEYIVILPPLGKKNGRERFVEYLKKTSDLAEKGRVTLVLENMPGTYCAKSKDCMEILKTANSPALRFAFNPAHFTAAGEKPFLGTSPSLRKWIRVLYINDGLFSGDARLPGYGNAEIKELISIMRCRSFSGFLSIKPGLDRNEETFHKAVRAFQRLLETM
jgi:aminoglycoside 3-N-acetyltransferase